jgi:hypothetical protein
VSDSLPCSRCGSPSDLASWLDRAKPELAPAECVSAACPRCEAELVLSLRSGEAAVGSLSPAPAIFRPDRRAQIPGLEVRARFDHVAVALGARSWLFRR